MKKEHTGFNADTKILSWKLTVNENETKLGYAAITDKLPEGITYVAGSAKIDNADFASPNSFLVDARGVIAVLLNNVSAKHIVTFDTKVDVNTDEFKDKKTVSIKNKATIICASNSSETVSNESEAKIGNDVLVKNSTSPTKAKPMVTYTVRFNPLQMDLQQALTTKEITLTDKLADGLYLDVASVKLYAATRTQTISNGAYTVSLTKGSEVNPAPKTSYSSVDNSFTVTIPDAAKAYILEYNAYIVKAGVELSNNILMAGSVIPETSANNAAKKEVKLASFGGASFALPKKSFYSLQINKKNENNQALAGATIALYKEKTDNSLLLTVECDPSTGTATLALPRTADLLPGTKLYWRETVAPAGYVANDEWHEVIVTDPNSADAVQAISFVNLPIGQADSAEISILKVDKAGSPLTDAQFSLYKDELCTILEQASKTVDANGKLTFTGLYPNRNYWVKETKAPSGYVLMSDAVKIQAKLIAEAQEIAIENEKANVTLKITKADKADNAKLLQGAEFVLYLDKECTKPFAAKQVTNAQGECFFNGLLPNTDYFIKEIKAPSGYALTASLVKVTTKENNTVFKELIENGMLPPSVTRQAKENPKTGIQAS